MIGYTKAREQAHFKRMFGKDTGIKDDFSALLTALYQDTVGALLAVSTLSCGGTKHWSPSGRLWLSLTVQAAMSCSGP